MGALFFPKYQIKMTEKTTSQVNCMNQTWNCIACNCSHSAPPLMSTKYHFYISALISGLVVLSSLLFFSVGFFEHWETDSSWSMDLKGDPLSIFEQQRKQTSFIKKTLQPLEVMLCFKSKSENWSSLQKSYHVHLLPSLSDQGLDSPLWISPIWKKGIWISYSSGLLL